MAPKSRIRAASAVRSEKEVALAPTVRSAPGSTAIAPASAAISPPVTSRKVFTRVILQHVHSVDTLAQTWEADISYEFLFGVLVGAYSGASALAIAQGSEGGIQDMDETHHFRRVFWPSLDHTVESCSLERWVSAVGCPELRARMLALDPALRSDPGARLLSFSLRTRRKFSQHFELELFPFDQQLLIARVSLQQEFAAFHFALAAENERVFAVSPGGHLKNVVNSAFAPMLSEWRLFRRFHAVSCASSPSTSRSNTRYAVLKVLVLVQRKWWWHFFLVIIPLTIILALALLIFDIDECFEGVCALLFVVFQIKAQVSSLLPRIGQSTWLDAYTLASMMFVTAVALTSTKTVPRLVADLLLPVGVACTGVSLAFTKACFCAIAIALVLGFGLWGCFRSPFAATSRALTGARRRDGKPRKFVANTEPDDGLESWPSEGHFAAI